MTYQTPTGWYADIDPDMEASSAPWHPVLQLQGVHAPVQIWFATEADCEDFIRREILGQPMLEDPT